MGIINKKNFASFVLSVSLLLSALPCDTYAIGVYDKASDRFTEELTGDYSEYGEFGDAIAAFDVHLNAQDDVKRKGVKKWWKKFKRFLKKNLRKMGKWVLKRIGGKNPEECAYTVAKFMRKMGKFTKVPTVSKAFDKLKEEIPECRYVEKIDKFQHKVEFYLNHRHLSPKNLVVKGEDWYADTPPGVYIGVAEGVCGAVLSWFPPTRIIGAWLLGDAATRIISALQDHLEQQQYDNPNKIAA